ncbi:hypothetical protein TELCIR_03742 [Teladorsagia circumcincta]|uniref:Malonyl-CoA:ACP transacylase (MAT) domain-containing protein n=1 Tax=Teladorsagia circumcincta TaxID=45464 RepID=A0A2G9UX09_TELCI|nr:hypothetical protein TELCIR_03742 [Teladorsagia circumcincta]
MRRAGAPIVTACRWVRRRATLPPTQTREPGILDEGTTFADVHSVVLDPISKLPYPEKLIDCSKAKEIFDRSSEILGYDILKLCTEGPKTKLDQTLYCQPAVFVSSVAALEKFKTIDESYADRITDAAGFSVGEFAALVAGGILSFEDALRVVIVRAQAMHECNQLIRSGMMTVRVNASSRLDEAMSEARELSRINVTSLEAVRSVSEIRTTIAKQITNPVKWEQIQQLLYRKHRSQLMQFETVKPE